jgi:hypothetical protein
MLSMETNWLLYLLNGFVTVDDVVLPVPEYYFRVIKFFSHLKL